MKVNYGSLEQCEYCFKYFSPSFRQENNHRTNWFCCDSHRTMFRMGRRLCQSCDVHSRLENQIVCNKCHKKYKN